ncbi:MAG: exonuclease SbcCD subunit D [Candidatus Nezhaarchaeota archaeon]|nr:exonuclease SbcCD subunit D [Candidatus Nezhaarchaeota archaeon]
MLVAHLADTHLGYRQYNLDEREEDFYEAFREAVDVILEEHVDVVVHAGDFFEDPRPPVRALYEAKQQLARLRDQGVRVYAVLGDHDLPKRRAMPPHSLLSDHLLNLGIGVSHDVVQLKGRELLVAGLHHHPRKYKENAREEVARLAKLAESYSRSLLILHQAVDRFLPFEYELCFDELVGPFSYVALGHVHRRGSAWLRRTLIAYSGSLEITSRDEIKSWREVGKGFYIVDLSKEEASLHKVDLSCVRPQIEAAVKYEELRQGILRVAGEAKLCRKKPIVHLRIEGSRVDRRRAYEEGRALSPYVLTWRPEFSEEDGRPMAVEAKRSLDLKQLLREALGSDEASKLAYELFNILRDGGKDKESRVEEAKRIVEDYYQRLKSLGSRRP